MPSLLHRRAWRLCAFGAMVCVDGSCDGGNQEPQWREDVCVVVLVPPSGGGGAGGRGGVGQNTKSYGKTSGKRRKATTSFFVLMEGGNP